MRQITKGREPASLTTYRQTPGASYDDYREKGDLRISLVREQRSLCCYCMQRIHPDGARMKIEHWKCQRDHEGLDLSYHNLLAGCLGGEDLPGEKKHCDTSKGERDLKFNPANPLHHIETRIGYELDGTIYSNDPEFDGQLSAVLNLNLEQIRNNRKGVLTGLLEWSKIERARLRGPIPRAEIENKIAHWSSSGPDLPPYCQVAVWWFQQKLAGMAA